MIMIPLPFCLAALCLTAMVRVWVTPSPRRWWAIGFLGILAFQEALVGARFGYGLENLRLVQPFSAAILPPLAFLSFRRPALDGRIWVHFVPLIAVVYSAVWYVDVLDGVLALNNLVYAGLLVRLGLRGSDGLPWANLANVRFVVGLLWIVVLVLGVSGFTDAVISYDFWMTAGENTQSIAGIASAVGIVVIGGVTLALYVWHRCGGPQEAEEAGLEPVFAQVNAMMLEERLFVDPDINLSRIARRAHLPVRDVSRAINQATGQNVSQYVNALRIEEACMLLQDEARQITEVVFQAGFNTKSNFNREFLRLKEMSPSQWRKEKGA